MPIDLGIRFPSEAESLRQQAEAEKHLTPTQRIEAVAGLLAVVQALSKAGDVREAQLKYHQRLEDDWRQRMMEFITKHAHSQ